MIEYLLTPVEGRTVIDPQTKETLPAEGKVLPLDSFWTRRINDGDVVINISSQPKKG